MMSNTQQNVEPIYIAWWNAQRLGHTSPEEKINCVNALLTQGDNTISFICEVVNIPEKLEEYKDNSTGGRGQQPLKIISNVSLTELDMGDIPICFLRADGHLQRLKGGTNWECHSNRDVAMVELDNIRIAAYHANASNKAASLVAGVIKKLQELGDKPWILVGDLNCLPGELEKLLEIQMQNRIITYVPQICYDGTTHTSPGGSTNTYDYVIASHGLEVRQVTEEEGVLCVKSDHNPILVTVNIF